MTTSWTARYGAALARMQARREAAERDGELIACGTTNNVDLVVTLTDELLARLVAEAPPALHGPRQTRAGTPEQLVTAIVQHVAAGEGVDLPATAATQDWLLERVSGRWQLGGTGAQVANQLATLGFSTLVHLTGCSPRQVAAFDHPARTLAPGEGGLVPVDEAANPADPTMIHPVLEYVAGVRVRVGGREVVAPAASRIIVNHDPVNSAVELREDYVAAVLAGERPIRRMLLSGFSQTVEPPLLQRFVDQSARAVRRWRAAGLELLVHVELGAMPHAADLAGVVESLALEVDSIGMNADELRDITLAWGIRPPAGAHAARTTLEALRHRVLTPRINVHAAAFAASLTSGDPEAEREALLMGALTASARALTGTFPTPDDLARALAAQPPHPDGLALLAGLGMPDGIARLGGDCLVVVPTMHVPRPAATVGLGDSFTAGTLALL